MDLRNNRNMKLHHTAALALLGWYLMMPYAKPGKILDDTSLARWSHVSSFDTAAVCDTAGRNAIERAKKDPDATWLEIALKFECIASDDPRLK